MLLVVTLVFDLASSVVVVVAAATESASAEAAAEVAPAAVEAIFARERVPPVP